MAEAKTAKNRAKRQKKKDRAKNKANDSGASKAEHTDNGASDVPFKKRRLVNGKELVFRPQGDMEEEEVEEVESETTVTVARVEDAVVVEERITIHEDD